MKNWLKNLFCKYWWAVVIAVSIVTAGALISVFSSYWLCRYILNFFDDWSIALSAGAAVILALAAFLTIRNSNEREKRRRKEDLLKEKRDREERLLNEIIEWAINVSNWRFEHKRFFKEMVGVSDTKQQQELTHAHIVEVMESFIEMRGKSQYISKVTEKFGKDLREAMERAIDALEAYIELLDEWQQIKLDEIAHTLDDEYQYYAKADEHAVQLEKFANEVIEEAAKMKTREIGEEGGKYV